LYRCDNRIRAGINDRQGVTPSIRDVGASPRFIERDPYRKSSDGYRPDDLARQNIKHSHTIRAIIGDVDSITSRVYRNPKREMAWPADRRCRIAGGIDYGKIVLILVGRKTFSALRIDSDT
jgi:hypothetical protein